MVVVVVAFMVVVVIFEIAYVVMLPAMGHQMCDRNIASKYGASRCGQDVCGDEVEGEGDGFTG